jgi:hypothetical protein
MIARSHLKSSRNLAIAKGMSWRCFGIGVIGFQANPLSAL